jgi:hypothetical protein
MEDNMPAQDIRSYNVGRFGDPEKVAKALKDSHTDHWDVLKGCLAAAEYGNFRNLQVWISAQQSIDLCSTSIARSLETAAARGADILPTIRDLFSGITDQKVRGDAMILISHDAVRRYMPHTFAAMLSVLREEGDGSMPYLITLRDAVRLVSRDSPDSVEQVQILRALHNEKVDLEDVGMGSGNTALMHLGVRFRMEEAEGEIVRLRKQFEAATAENAQLREIVSDPVKYAAVARSRRYNMT